MARGAAAQENLLNKNAGSQFSSAQNLYGSLNQDYNSILAQPGYTKDQINTQMNSAMTPIAGQIASARQSMTNRAGATRNSAGLVSGERDLARTGAQLGSQAAWGVQSNADNVALQERDRALAGKSSLYAPTLSSASNLYGEATNAMNSRNSVLSDIAQGVKIFRDIIPAPKD